MSNTINSAGYAVTAETLRQLLVKYPVLKTLAHQFDAVPGSGVKVPTVSATTAGLWSTNKAYTNIDRTVSAITINPSDWDIAYHDFQLSSLELGQVTPQAIARLAESGAHAVGKSLIDYLIALCTAANVTHETPAATVNFSAFSTADAALADRGVSDPKFALFGSAAYLDMLNDDTIHSALIRGDSADPVVSGQLGNVIGFPNLSRYAGFTNPTSGTSVNTKAIIGGVDGFALVTGIPIESQVGNAAMLTQVIEQNSGLQALLRTYVEPGTGIAHNTIAIGFAAKLGVAAALQRIVDPH